MKPSQAAEAALSADFVRDLLHYDAATGIFWWRKSRLPHLVGARAGTVHPDGYRMISIKGRCYNASRLAWLYVHGTWPEHYIDHINGHRGDDRISNLREATKRQNTANQRVRQDCSSGAKGILCYYGKKRTSYYVRIGINGKQIRVGKFYSLNEAQEAYAAKAREIFGEFARMA